jgi:transposase-like protein
MSDEPKMIRWPNYCPFCGTHARSGGTGNRHTVFNCGNCHADYIVEFYGAYPPTLQAECDEEFVKHGGRLDGE